jgi:hypothetical protein
MRATQPMAVWSWRLSAHREKGRARGPAPRHKPPPQHTQHGAAPSGTAPAGASTAPPTPDTAHLPLFSPPTVRGSALPKPHQPFPVGGDVSTCCQTQSKQGRACGPPHGAVTPSREGSRSLYSTRTASGRSATMAETWDQSKENFAPVRAGRNAKALSEVPLTPGKASLADLEDRRRCAGCRRPRGQRCQARLPPAQPFPLRTRDLRKFLDEIAAAQDDPLPVWLRCAVRGGAPARRVPGRRGKASADSSPPHPRTPAPLLFPLCTPPGSSSGRRRRSRPLAARSSCSRCWRPPPRRCRRRTAISTTPASSGCGCNT